MTFKLFGTKIYVSYLFVSLLTLLLLYKDSQILALCLLYSFAHETGHIISMKLLGATLNEIKFMPFGIAIKTSDLSALSKLKQTIVLLSGVLINTVLLPLNFEINLALIMFNLLPIGNLDGGRILKLFVNDKIHKIISIIILMPLMILFVKYQSITLFFTGVYLFLTLFLK